MHHIALVYLRHKAAAGGLIHAQGGLSLEDLALDCIAGLFERDSLGRFCVLSRYFERIQWKSLNDVELLSAIRRLVFSHVNQEIYRTYKEADPILHRIIRNLRDAAAAIAGSYLVEKVGETWVAFNAEPGSHHLPIAPPEYLGPYVSQLVAQHQDTRSILAEIRDLLQGQQAYEAGYPIIPLAVLIRGAFAALANSEAETESVPPAVENDLHEQDMSRLLEEAICSTGARFRPGYVGKGRVPAKVFETYLAVAKEILNTELLTSGDGNASYAERLRQRIPDLSEGDYKLQHRSILEYLVKTARQEYLQSIQRHMR